jgi:hypothetical protein
MFYEAGSGKDRCSSLCLIRTMSEVWFVWKILIIFAFSANVTQNYCPTSKVLYVTNVTYVTKDLNVLSFFCIIRIQWTSPLW